MAVSVSLMNGDQVSIDLQGTSTVGQVRERTADALGCTASAIKLTLGDTDKDDSSRLLQDDELLEKLSGFKFIAVKRLIDPSLVNLTSTQNSEYDEGQTDFYKSSTWTYGDTVVWQTSSNSACHIGGWGGSTHEAKLSADKTVLVVKSGCVQRGSGELYDEDHEKFAPDMVKHSVQYLESAKGLL